MKKKSREKLSSRLDTIQEKIDELETTFVLEATEITHKVAMRDKLTENVTE